MTQDISTTAAKAALRIYIKPVLTLYDAFVHGFSNPLVWRCPTRLMLEMYNTHVSANHLDVGVGTGYFLDKCTFPSKTPTISLLDFSSNALARTTKRITRYNPKTYLANIYEPLPITTAPFDSIGMNYVLHCLPGSMLNKAVVLHHLKPLLNPSGVLFGSTILGRGVYRTPQAKLFMRTYNAIKAFSNTADDVESLEQILGQTFPKYQVQVVGCVAFFEARF
jgi:ubiquinone/menaquinone biosynthesis C-methylase UbiE